MTYHSQNDEERYIIEFFKDSPPGSFLDIGAFNGRDYSNVYALVLKGWSGVSVEPAPIAFVGLRANYADHPDITLVNAAVTTEGGLVQFWEGGPYSTSQPGNYQQWKSLASFSRRFWIASVSLADFGKTLGWDYDFISIDTEGGSLSLALAVPLEQCERLKMLCIEHDRHIQRLIDHFRPWGFKQLACNVENLILVR